MTVDPDLDWLADEEGNLRPQIARDLVEAPPPPAPGPMARMPARPPEPPTPHPRRPVSQPPEPAVRVSAPSNPVVAFSLGLIAALIGFGLGISVVRHPGVSSEGLTASLAATPVGRPASANGINVNVRSGPGLNFPTISKLMAGEGLVVRAEQDGWFAVTTNAGTNGWVFGAFLRGHGNADHGAAIVTQLMSFDGDVQRIVLRPGDKVFVVRNGDGQTDVVLPTGRRLRVPAEVLARVD